MLQRWANQLETIDASIEAAKQLLARAEAAYAAFERAVELKQHAREQDSGARRQFAMRRRAQELSTEAAQLESSSAAAAAEVVAELKQIGTHARVSSIFSAQSVAVPSGPAKASSGALPGHSNSDKSKPSVGRLLAQPVGAAAAGGLTDANLVSRSCCAGVAMAERGGRAARRRQPRLKVAQQLDGRLAR